MIQYYTHQLAELFMHGEEKHFKKGTIIHEPDRVSESVYYIVSGYVKIYIITPSGDTHLHCIHRPKKVFPLRAAILNMTGHSYYEAITDVTVKCLPRKAFIEALESNHTLAMIVLRKVTALFDDYISKVNNLQFSNTYARLTSMLIYFAEGFSEKQEDKIVVTIPMTHQELADLGGMARETVSREIEKLKAKDIITVDHHHIIIHDLERLKAECPAYVDPIFNHE